MGVESKRSPVTEGTTMTKVLVRMLACRGNAAAACCALMVAGFVVTALLSGDLVFLAGGVGFAFGWLASDDDEE